MDKKEFLTHHGSVTAWRGVHVPADVKQHALSRFESQRVVADLAREPSRDLLSALCTLATGIEPPRATTPGCSDLISALDAAVAARQILFVKGWHFAGTLKKGATEAKPTDTPAEILARQLMGDRKELKFEGRRYRWAGSPTAIRAGAKEGYRPIPDGEATGMLKRMSEQVAATPEERAAWADVLKEPDKKAPGPPGSDAPTLLRYVTVAVQAVTQAASTASTPSQLKPQVADEHWVEVEILYEDGTPYEGKCSIELPDGRISDGPPGAGGVIRIDALSAAGTCKLKFPDLDAGSFRAN